MRFGFQGSGFRVQGSGFRFQVSGFRVQGSGFRVQGSLSRVQCPGFTSVPGRCGGLGTGDCSGIFVTRVGSVGGGGGGVYKIAKVWIILFRIKDMGAFA